MGRPAVMRTLICISAAALSGCGVSSASSTPSATGTAVEQNGKLAFAANRSGTLAYTVKDATATAGKVTVSMTNMSGVEHNLAIQRGYSGPVIAQTTADFRGSASFTVTLKPGRYTFFCTVPGHRAAGMWGTLTVR